MCTACPLSAQVLSHSLPITSPQVHSLRTRDSGDDVENGDSSQLLGSRAPAAYSSTSSEEEEE